MRVMVMGSLQGPVPLGDDSAMAEHTAWVRAGRVLGWALAERDVTVIVGSASDRTIDPHIVAGYEDFCREHPEVVRRVEVQFPADQTSQRYGSDRAGTSSNLHFTRYENEPGPTSAHRWTTSHFSALRKADLLVVIGGGTGTSIVGSYAVSSQIPVLAVPEFGRAAKDLFLLARHTYGAEVPRLGSNPTRETAQRLVSFGLSLAGGRSRGTHSYFVSYSRAEPGPADFVEVMLRRFDRTVFRDESAVKVGDELESQLLALIEEADTFIALWSARYAQSEWCGIELEHALRRRASGSRPARIVVIELDDHPSTAQATLLTRLPGRTREQLDLGIRRVIDQETQSSSL